MPPTHPPEPENLACPRCESTNTKFCYYNNYNLSQPRYFCKSCRRYWTRGGTLRNIPVGGGTRKHHHSKRQRSSASSTTTAPPLPPPTSTTTTTTTKAENNDNNSQLLDNYDLLDLNLNDHTSSFTSLLTASTTATTATPPFLGYGLEDLGLGFGYGPLVNQVGPSGGDGGGDYFAWPELAISTTATHGKELLE